MGAKWIKISTLYFLLGVAFGLYMHATVALQWAATHAHINVVGWLTTVAIGVIYSVYPKAGISALGKAHFLLYIIGFLILLIGMLIIHRGVGAPLAVIHICVLLGGLALALSIIIFIINVFQYVREGIV